MIPTKYESNRRLRDISPALRPGLVTWPGDAEFSQISTWQIGPECPVNVARITLSTHAGAHADAPSHYTANGGPVESLPLERYVGPCRIIDVRGAGSLVMPSDILHFLTDTPPRVLLRTYDTVPLNAWDPEFTAVAPETINLLARNGVFLIGLDTPSVDPETSKDLAAHNAVLVHGMSILEGLVLDEIEAGDYELIALPLRLAELDAAPVRAVLRDLISDS